MAPEQRDMGSSLQHRGQRLLRQTDALIMHLSRVLSTPAGTDKALMTLHYTLKLVCATLARARTLQRHQLLASISRKAPAALLPGETLLVATFPNGLGSLETSGRALAGVISDFRIFVRLWGLLGIYEWGKATWASPPRDRVVRAVVWAQIAANVGFQWWENVAYLAMKGVLRGEQRFGEAAQERYWAWSSRFWAAHVALEAVRLLRVWQMDGGQEVLGKGAEDGAVEKAEREEKRLAWWRSWYVNAAYAPMTVHWSMIEGCLSEEWLGALGIVAGSIGFKQLWKATA